MARFAVFEKLGDKDFLQTAFAVAVVTAISASLAFDNLDFPLGFHWDEPIKVRFAGGGNHNYLHPPLLIVLARLLVWISAAEGKDTVLLAGRTVSALSAVGASVLFYSVLRRYADRLNALVWSCIFAASPAIAVHAHYFKEDAVLIMTICLSLYALVRLKERQALADLIFFGAALGLTVTAKYAGAGNSVVLFAFAIPFCSLSLRSTLVVLAASLLAVVAVFALSFAGEPGGRLSTVLSGLASELRHAEGGHDLSEWFYAGYGLTHFRYHVIPSLTLPTVAVSLGLVGWAVIVKRNRTVAIFATAAAIWLFALELSPLKLVGLMRYVLPVIVYLLLAAGVACSLLAASRSRLLATIVGLASLAATAHAGILYVDNLEARKDTRTEAMNFIDQKEIKNFLVDFPMGRPVPMTDAYKDLAKADYLVSVKFARFLRGGDLPQQAQRAYLRASLFHCLDGHVVAQFSRIYGDYGYVAPTVKIYDLRRARECVIG